MVKMRLMLLNYDALKSLGREKVMEQATLRLIHINSLETSWDFMSGKSLTRNEIGYHGIGISNGKKILSKQHGSY